MLITATPIPAKPIGKLIRWSDLINLFCFRCEYIFAFPQIACSTLAEDIPSPGIDLKKQEQLDRIQHYSTKKLAGQSHTQSEPKAAAVYGEAR